MAEVSDGRGETDVAESGIAAVTAVGAADGAESRAGVEGRAAKAQGHALGAGRRSVAADSRLFAVDGVAGVGVGAARDPAAIHGTRERALAGSRLCVGADKLRRGLGRRQHRRGGERRHERQAAQLSAAQRRFPKVSGTE